MPSQPPGTFQTPHHPKYEYVLSGSRQAPWTDGERKAYSSRFAKLRVHLEKMGRGGGLLEYTLTTTVNEDQGQMEKARTRWGGGKVDLHGALLQFPDREQHACSYDPPADLLRTPVRAGAYATQRWSSQTCSGTTDVTIGGRETIVDALGRSWDVWKIETTSTFRWDDKYAGTDRVARWFSPGLGADVRIEHRLEATLRGLPFGWERTALLFWP